MKWKAVDEVGMVHFTEIMAFGDKATLYMLQSGGVKIGCSRKLGVPVCRPSSSVSVTQHCVTW